MRTVSVRNTDDDRLPDRQRFEQPIIIRDGWMSKILMGLVCSSIVAVLMNFGGVRWIVVHIFALFLSLLGKGVYEVHPAEPLKAEVTTRIEAAKEKYRLPIPDSVKPGAGQHLPLGHLPIGLPPVIIGGQKTEAEREAERLRKEQADRNTLLAEADVLGLTVDKAWPLEKLRIEVGLAKQEAREAPERNVLLAKADKLGLLPDPVWDLKTLREQVKDAEDEARQDADYQAEHRAWERAMEAYNNQIKHGPNARCPQCGNAMRVSPANAKRTLMCKRCLGTFGGSRAVAMWRTPPAPKEPLPPKKKPSLLKRVFG